MSSFVASPPPWHLSKNHPLSLTVAASSSQQCSNSRSVKFHRHSRFDQLHLAYDPHQDDPRDLDFDPFPCSSDAEDIEANGPNSTSFAKLPKSKKAVTLDSSNCSAQNNSSQRPNMANMGRSSKSSQSKKPNNPIQIGALAYEGQTRTPNLESRRKQSYVSSWEEWAYEIIRIQKLRNMAAEKEKKSFVKTEQQLTLLAPTRPLKQNVVEKVDDTLFHRVAKKHNFGKSRRPLIEYLHSMGLEEEHFQKIANRRRMSLQANVIKVKERLEYLTGIGVKEEDLSKLIVRHPQILEYTVEGMMKPRIQYLRSLGVPDSKLGRVVTVAPSLLECSLERSFKPKVKFLLEEVKINAEDLPKIVVLSPQILTQSIEESLRPRMLFLMNKLGACKESVAKMITKHPQLLHYSIEDGIQPRIDFLKGIGLTDSDVLKVLSRFTQILSLSIQKSLEPKFDYLTKELKCGVKVVTSFPAYFSLSLDQRIRPRHQFLVALNRLPSGQFPMHLLAVTDHDFCRLWANTTAEEYHAFRNSLLLTTFVRKFERRNRLRLEL